MVPAYTREVQRSKAERRARYRTRSLIRRRDFETARYQWEHDLATVMRSVESILRKTAEWDDDFLLDMGRWLTGRLNVIDDHLHELAAAGEF